VEEHQLYPDAIRLVWNDIQSNASTS